MAEVLAAQGRELGSEETADLRTLGFRSLDFSELALRVEDETGEELNFEADRLRAVHSVRDVLDFFVEVTENV